MLAATGSPLNINQAGVLGQNAPRSTGATRPGYISSVHRDLNRSILLGLKRNELKEYFDSKGNPPILASESSFEALSLAKVPLGIEKLSRDSSFTTQCLFLPYINQACYFHKNTVYLWNYKTEKFHFFDTLAGVITSVGLVKARKDVFPSMKYILVVATTSALEFYHLDVSVDETVSLYTSEHKMSNNDYSITKIIGSETGRIFMGSKRGAILELKYQLSDGTFPFSKKMSLVNCTKSFFSPLSLLWPSSPAKEIVTLKIDEDRKTLYTLSADSTIQIINLGKGGDCFGLVGEANLGKSTAQKQLGLRDETLLTPIVDLHVVPATDSSTLRLVVIVASGISLYYRSAKQSNPNQATGLVLDFVRPSTYTSFLLNGNRGLTSLYKRGILISATPSGANSSTISTTFIEGTPASRDNLAIQARTLNVEMLLLDIQEQDLTAQSYVTKAVAAHLPGLDDVVSQYFSPARKFNLITSEGVVQLIKLRPVDQLFKDFSKTMAASRSIGDLARRFGPSESCSMILALLSEYPLALPERDGLTCLDTTGDYCIPQYIKDKLILAFRELAGSPAIQNSRTLVHSNGFAGALLFFSRLLTPVWNSRIVALRYWIQDKFSPA
ncbi:hypothetical protein DSO57_1028964 [Entomophthora muscae]|uniref:Uncharacterized protein n=1 Tax=Entomophthora muscae TaxID=34485 RepID=A0ACC2RS86_9FUNG|nr:hypothetical protein DSO57_1028964 [Entomophthora muscae]